jgi:ER lumen protein retaining receptor
MYNLFRLGGDFLHMLSILVLIYKIHTQWTCAGISLKTQILYAVVYVSRYTDLLNSYISLYNSGMKLVFICSSVRQPRTSMCTTSCPLSRHRGHGRPSS